MFRTGNGEDEGASLVTGPAKHGRRRKIAHHAFAGRHALAAGIVLTLLAGGTTAIHAFCADPNVRSLAREARVVTLAATDVTSDDADKVRDTQKNGDTQKPRQTDFWVAARSKSELKLRGAVPSEEDRKTLLGMVKAHFPDLSVDERLRVGEANLQREQWLGAVSFGLQQLSHLKEGRVRLSSTNLNVSGEAASAEDYTQLKKALTGALPAGLNLKGEDVRPPVADPFVFTADLGVNALSLTGSIPSEDARKQVRDLSRQLFARPGLDDRLELASGAPDDWDAAVTAALHALSRLETGSVALSGIAVSIEGVAPDQGTAIAVSYQLRRDLPEVFSTSESIKWKEAKVPSDMAPFDEAQSDTAANVIPRIKTFVRTKGPWSNSELPPLAPLLDQR